MLSMQPQRATEKFGALSVVAGFGALLRIPALVALFTGTAIFQAVRVAVLQDADIWWHLRAGLWILENHAIPHHGIYSQHASAPWVASGWLYDVAVAIGYSVIGLRILPLLAMIFGLTLAIVTFLLASARSGNFWRAVALSAIAQYTITLSSTPELFSILLFGIELSLLVRSNRTGSLRPLFWLPALFLFWANLHSQFVLGLLMLLLFAAAVALEQWLCRSGFQPVLAGTRLSLSRLSAIVGASFLATLINPYTFHLLPQALHSSYNRLLFEYFGNMSALDFRRPQEFVLLLLSMSAFVVLGRKRPVDLFKIALLTVATLVSLRIQRDSWIVVLAAIGVIGESFAQPQLQPTRSPSLRTRAVAAAVLVSVVFLLASLRIPRNEVLMQDVYNSFPAKACDFIRSSQLPQPVFNAYRWGGFLTWYLPEYPVAIDSRLALYGETFSESYFKAVSGTERMESNPAFARAQTLLLERQSGMAKALATLPALRAQFRVVYQDEMAIVFVRQQ